jgi:hypothetical protein
MAGLLRWVFDFIVADLLKLLLVFTASFIVRSKIFSAILYQLLTQFLTLGMTRPLKCQSRKEQRYRE